jgi:hypothetical protein
MVLLKIVYEDRFQCLRGFDITIFCQTIFKLSKSRCRFTRIRFKTEEIEHIIFPNISWEYHHKISRLFADVLKRMGHPRGDVSDVGGFNSKQGITKA